MQHYLLFIFYIMSIFTSPNSSSSCCQNSKKKHSHTLSHQSTIFAEQKKTFYTRHASLCFIRLTISSSCTLTLSNLYSTYFPTQNQLSSLYPTFVYFSLCCYPVQLLSEQKNAASGFKNRPSSWIFQVATTPAETTEK
jgi:hypothetical protein